MAEDLTGRDDPLDSTLIQRWKEGDERAATALVERHGTALARYIGSLGERDSADEVVQDTFVRAFSSLDTFRGDSSLRTWLFTIARRLVVDRRRALRRRRDVGSLEDVDAATEYTALDGLIASEAKRKVWGAVGKLSPTQREVFLLRVNDGLSYKEIAEVAGTTEGAARVHYHNALRTVKENLNE
jgi:RNA polymerase sigma-70 factor (ECF subfamily)